MSSELRERFESRTEIKRHLVNGYIFYDGHDYQLNDKFNNEDCYLPNLHKINIGWVRGAWFMFQELNK